MSLPGIQTETLQTESRAGELRVTGLCLRYGDVTALSELSLTLTAGSLTAVLGPSGCGKTSLLRCLAGFEAPEHGVIELSGRRLVDTGSNLFVPPERRGIGLVFQQGALFPHLTVERNVAYGLRRDQDPARVQDCLELVGLFELRQRYPDELSGGQAQRVALARALVPEPSVILLDEPFASLDASSREQVRAEVLEVLHRSGTTCLLVTHDQEEALSSAEHLVVMACGRKLQEGSPEEVYRRPVSDRVARFLGAGALLDVEREGQELRCLLGTLDGNGFAGLDHHQSASSGSREPVELKAFLRPEEIECCEHGGVAGTVTRSTYYGHDRIDEVTLDGGAMVLVRQLSIGPLPEPGERVGVRLRPGAGWLVVVDDL